MMVNPSKKQREMQQKLFPWWVFDENGNRLLKEGAPKEIIELDKEYDRLYVH